MKTPNPIKKNKEYNAKLKQGGIIVAQVDGLIKEQVEKEINHYAMIYSQDGEIEVFRNYILDKEEIE